MSRALTVLVVATLLLIGCSVAAPSASLAPVGVAVGASGTPTAPTAPTASAPPTPSAASVPPATSPRASGCVDPPLDLAAIVVLDPATRLACFGGSSLTFQATVLKPISDCGVGPRIAPAWFCLPGIFLAVPGASPDSGLPPLAAYWDPSSRLTPASFPAEGIIQITGHFDDLAARTCNAKSAPGQSPQPAAQLVMACRETFVVTTVH
jgi:hypothetical protein